MSVPSSPSRDDGNASQSTGKTGESSTETLSSELMMIQTAYTETKRLMEASSGVLDTVSTMVSLRNAVEDPPLDEGDSRYSSSISIGTSSMQYGSSNVSLLTPNRGHHAIVRALEKLEGLEKEESELLLRTPLTTELTKIATGDDSFTSPKHAIETLEALSQSVPRRVCQHPFKKNDIVWVCRTCQADETCVLCHSCFKQSNHEGHDVAFYHAQAGGCCDCGDPDAWDPAGFCPHHGPASNQSCFSADGRLGPLSGDVIQRVQGVIPATVDWMVERVARSAEEGHERTEEGGQQGVAESSTTSSRSNETTSNENTTGEAQMAEAHVAVFSPSAAGSSRSRRGITGPPVSSMASASTPVSKSLKGYTKSERLGFLAREGGGLYLILRSDDINTHPQIADALRDLFGTSSLYSESILQKVVRSLKQFGQLIVWGTMELLADLSSTQIRLWLDGDRVASGVLGAAMLHRARILKSHGMFCAILTRRELELEQRAVVALQWLFGLARSCDPLCQKVAEAISPDRHLVPLLQCDFKLSSRVTKYWHSLLLTLLAVPTFKSHLAAAYCDTYQAVTAEYARGMGVLERSGYALSVQFLNRVTYVVDLVQRRDLLGKLGASLYQTLEVAATPPNSAILAESNTRVATAIENPNDIRQRLDPNHFVLTHRRYSPCISDLKCVLNVKGMPRLFASKSSSFLKDWIASLALGQMMDSQTWRDWSQGHVELEVRGWVGAFNASISLGSLFERLLSWDDSDPSPIPDPDSPLSKNLLTCVDLTNHVLTSGVLEWQKNEMATYEATTFSEALEPFMRSSASLPFSTLSVKSGSLLAFRALPMSQVTPFSFHLPLHRFVAACLREASLRDSGVDDLLSRLSHSLSDDVLDDLFLGLMEFPLLVLSRAAQVRAGLWRRNGNGLNDQVLNYAEPPFCRAMRDADLLLVQFSMLGRTRHQTMDYRPESDVGTCFMIHLLLHRLGLFEFCGLAKAPDTDINRYLDEVQQGLYKPEKSTQDTSDSFLLPSTFSPAKDTAAFLLLLEEFLHLIIVVVSELPGIPPKDKSDHTQQAKWRLKREVIHRLASGEKTHSELAEVHHVLSHWDNVFLSEEGKLVNPDDATGAALASVLSDIASRKVSRGKMEPDKWELNREAWDSYDPSFFHINSRNHQQAADNRPSLDSDTKFKCKPKPFCPPPLGAHHSFSRLRRDITADSTILAITYRTLHMHIRDSEKKKKGLSGLRGAIAYENQERSETALARAVHLLTLGAYAWKDASADNLRWRQEGGGSIGSIFFDRSDDFAAPTAKEWVSAALLVNPRIQQSSDWYEGEENCLHLLRRLAVDGGFVGSFVAQDQAVKAGAAWLCEFAAANNIEARKIVDVEQNKTDGESQEKQETELEKRKRMAMEKVMARMKAQAAKFASMTAELDDENEEGSADRDKAAAEGATPQQHIFRQGSFASGSSVASTSDSDKATTLSAEASDLFIDSHIPSRLLKNRPQCIICNSDDANSERQRAQEEGVHRKSRRRRNDGGNALAFVGYTQASTVLKGGGGPPSSGSVYSSFSPVRRFVGAHLALCGHAIHSECWESYLASVSHREDRIIGKRDEFRCPLCQNLSNCLVPFIDAGIDWIDSASQCDSSAMDISKAKSDDDGVADSMSCDTLDLPNALSLDEFLVATPWWVSRHNKSIVWDGQCAFITESKEQEVAETADARKMDDTRFLNRSVRGLRKKDLYSAWNAMMKTPRFLRRRLKANHDTGVIAQGPDSSGSYVPSSASESAGETVVWRRFMDQVSDITYRADGKRLGDENLHSDFGEFRHYIVEKYAYNMAYRFAGKETTDWPSCVFSTTLSDNDRQELSREKLLSKLMMSIQAFTYSSCCEINEARRLTNKARARASAKFASMPGTATQEKDVERIFSNYGISDIVCNGHLIIMPRPNATEDDGSQPFHGRLGKLRYFGLAVMAAAGAVAADLVQLVLAFPVASSAEPSPRPYRAPIVYPLLYGHVLTHLTAAICASAGRSRARSDTLDVCWPIPFSSRGSFVLSGDENLPKDVDSIADDSEGFVKLGLLARVLQVLLGKIDMLALNNIAGLNTEFVVLKTLEKLRGVVSSEASIEKEWTMNCILLLEVALSKHSDTGKVPDSTHAEEAIRDRFEEGCILAAQAAVAFVADAGGILQLLVPSIMERYPWSVAFEITPKDDTILDTWEQLESTFKLESISRMLESDAVREVVTNWYEAARAHARSTRLPSATISGSGAAVTSRLFQTQGFRTFDWPMESCDNVANPCGQFIVKPISGDPPKNQGSLDAAPMEVDSVDDSTSNQGTLASDGQPHISSSVVTFNSKRSVPLIGGFTKEIPVRNTGRPRVATIPISYTDLYAELGSLLPDSEQTAVCLICGEVLNAGGKGECTKHSYKCGAGAGLFFLLQECTGLIMHNGKAAYIHSPYVDSHGETPQYRGRPLNLDMERYDLLHEVWSGHRIRQQVLSERGKSRQIIVPDFY